MVARKVKKIRIATAPGRIENVVKPGILRSQYFRFNR
jgi:hypothetical protein